MLYLFQTGIITSIYVSHSNCKYADRLARLLDDGVFHYDNNNYAEAINQGRLDLALEELTPVIVSSNTITQLAALKSRTK